MRIAKDDFNTKIFQIKMGNIEEMENDLSEDDILQAIEDAKAEGYKHLSVKIPTFEKYKTNLLLKNGFNLVDTQLMFEIDTQVVAKTEETWGASPTIYREFQNDDKSEIVEIARTAYSLDQFHSDIELERSRSDLYYAEWAGNCCEGFSDKVMVISSEDGHVIGFITLDFKNGDAYVGLAAIDRGHREKGFFSLMIEKTLRAIKRQGKMRMHYGTQLSNMPVLKTMARYGGAIEYSRHVLHRMI